MYYQEYSALPKRAYPLNGIPLFGLPGKRYVPPKPPTPYYGGGGGGYYEREYDLKKERERAILEDDQEIFEVVSALMITLN